MSDELRKIQRTSNSTELALVAQAMDFLTKEFEEFKVQTTKDFNEVKNNTRGLYAPKSTVEDHERRIQRLEKAALWVLGATFSIVFFAIVGLVVVKR